MDAMIDLETWGTRPGAALRSIGMVTFALGRPAEGREPFYSNIDSNSCEHAGLCREQGTVDWWARQSRQAQESLLINPRPLADVVALAEQWLGRRQIKYVWCQGANFDVVLWEAACRAVGREAPWRFFNVRDTRTLYDAGGFDPRTLDREGIYHNALEDAIHQVACVQAAWARVCDPVLVGRRAAQLALAAAPRPGGGLRLDGA